MLAPPYRPRRPTETVLYAVVRDWLQTFLAHARQTYDAPLPRYVEEELRGYLRCGVFAHGFVHAHCDTCGHDLLVAFSCKARAACPSCAGRRMANVAAHLVDRVLPAVPVRQWVLSLPFELRQLAAFRADVLSALARIFHEAVFARYASWAKGTGLGEAPTGSVCHVQRFGSSLNLHVHFHSMVLDGVFTRDAAGRPVFHPAPAPAQTDLEDVLRRVHRRAVAWLGRKGLLESASIHGDAHDSHGPLAACAALAMQRGSVRSLRDQAEAEEGVAAAAPEPPRAEGEAVDLDGFNLHASVAVAGDDDLGRERLMRYGARPPLALDRLRRLPDGRIAYRIKKLRDGRAKHRIMTPLELLARLSAIIPPPRYPLLRYAGVLGPRSRWRRELAPRPREPETCAKATRAEATRPEPESQPPRGARAEPTDSRHLPRASTKVAAATPAHATISASPVPPAPSAGLRPATGAGVVLTPNVISVKHWQRVLGGLLYAATPRVDWVTLLRRSFEADVLACPSCGGRLRVRGQTTDPTTVRLVLESLAMATEAPKPARARDPTDVFDELAG